LRNKVEAERRAKEELNRLAKLKREEANVMKRKEKAATKIQSIFRGSIARDKYEKQRANKKRKDFLLKNEKYRAMEYINKLISELISDGQSNNDIRRLFTENPNNIELNITNKANQDKLDAIIEQRRADYNMQQMVRYLISKDATNSKIKNVFNINPNNNSTALDKIIQEERELKNERNKIIQKLINKIGSNNIVNI
jgi:hypothetical protein